MVFRYKHGDRPLEGYTIQRGVGTGGFGEVYYAVSDGGRQVALKCLHQNPEIELRGVGQCMNLKSPYLVTIFDVKKPANGMAFVIMEYVTGPSLRELLHQNPEGMGSQKAAFFIRELAKGLGYLHDRGIVHRDLKPENIFFEEGCIKIGDYGLSKYISVSRQSAQTISVGTVHYMAPEIGSGRYHRGIDIYALGIILYEMLTGRVPFTGDSFGEILMKHLTVEPDLSGIDPSFRDVIRKALLKNPDERYGCVEDLLEELLKQPEVETLLKDFQPESISKAGRQQEIAKETVVLGPPPIPKPPEREEQVSPPPAPAQPEMKPGPPPPPGPAPSPAPAAQPAAFAPGAGPAPIPAAQVLPADSGGFFSREKTQRRLLALMTSGAMAVVITLLQEAHFSTALGSFLLILSGAFGVLLSEREVPGRLMFEPGFPRRLLTLCITSPLYLLFANVCFLEGSRRDYKGTVIALIVSTALIHWGERTRRNRNQRINLGQAFLAGLCGYVATMIAHGNVLVVAGVLAAVSLVANVSSPFTPRPTRRKLGPGQRVAPGPQGNAAAPVPSPPPAPAPQPGMALAAPPPPAAQAAAPNVAAPNGAMAKNGKPPCPMGVLGHIFWLGLSAILLATGLTLFIVSLAVFDHTDDRYIGLGFAFSSLFFAIFSFRLGIAPVWPTFWTWLRGFLMTAFISGIGFSGITLLMEERDDDVRMFALGSLIFFLVFTFFLGLLPKRLSRLHSQAGQQGGEASSPSPGWGALGALLVTLGISTVLASAFLGSPIGDSILQDMGISPGFDARSYVQSQIHLLAGCAFFVPGLFCMLKTRQVSGAAHVFRGAIGFSGMGALVFLLSKFLEEWVRIDPSSGKLIFMSIDLFPVMGLFILGVTTALFLFWPARRISPGRIEG